MDEANTAAIELYWCEPFKAKIMESACRKRKKVARRLKPFQSILSEFDVEKCLACPGLEGNSHSRLISGRETNHNARNYTSLDKVSREGTQGQGSKG